MWDTGPALGPAAWLWRREVLPNLLREWLQPWGPKLTVRILEHHLILLLAEARCGPWLAHDPASTMGSVFPSSLSLSTMGIYKQGGASALSLSSESALGPSDAGHEETKSSPESLLATCSSNCLQNNLSQYSPRTFNFFLLHLLKNPGC